MEDELEETQYDSIVNMAKLHELCHYYTKELDTATTDRNDIHAQFTALQNVNSQQAKEIERLTTLRTSNRTLERQVMDLKKKLDEKEETEASNAKATCIVATLQAQTLSNEVERWKANHPDQEMARQREAKACEDTLEGRGRI